MPSAPGGTGTSAVTFFWKASSTICSKSFVSAVRELLRFEADAGMELYFKPLAGILINPLAVDALVLLGGPGILEYVQLEALVLQARDISQNALSVAALPVLEGVSDGVRHKGYSVL